MGNTSGVDTVIKRTADGINWTAVPGNTSAYGQWYNNLFQHININYANRAYWDGNSDAVGNTLNNNTMFPGYLGNVQPEYYCLFYAGKKMLVNGNRLWDIVPK